MSSNIMKLKAPVQLAATSMKGKKKNQFKFLFLPALSETRNFTDKFGVSS